jgi:hypothetical protein
MPNGVAIVLGQMIAVKPGAIVGLDEAQPVGIEPAAGRYRQHLRSRQVRCDDGPAADANVGPAPARRSSLLAIDFGLRH